MKDVKKIQFGELINEKSFPQLQVIAEDRTYYLSPFRKYCFQVSGDEFGDGDYGSNSVFGLDSLMTMYQSGPSNIGGAKDVRKYVIANMIFAALSCFAEYLNNKPWSDNYWTVGTDVTFYGSWARENDSQLATVDRFVDAVYNYLS